MQEKPHISQMIFKNKIYSKDNLYRLHNTKPGIVSASLKFPHKNYTARAATLFKRAHDACANSKFV